MTIARTSPPAKLNLFLEIPARRDDGFHEIDTVMVGIDWRDELVVESINEPRVDLVTNWLPSMESVAEELGLQTGHSSVPKVLQIPSDGSNLVVRALNAFRERFGVQTGFRVKLGKRIPAGAGMGGASSDAAHAIACAAQIHHFDDQREVLHEIGSSIGSDVPFFLPSLGGESEGQMAAHATGRGERLSPLLTRTSIHFVVAYPPAALSTGGVYGRLKVPPEPVSSHDFRRAFLGGDGASMQQAMMNRLSEPALEILPELGDLVESLWQSGLQPCQLTGSGSACFGVAKDSGHARDVVNRLKIELQPGVLLRAVQAVPAAAPVKIEPS